MRRTQNLTHCNLSFVVIGRCLPDIKLLGTMPPDFSNIPGLPPSVNEMANLVKNGTGLEPLNRINKYMT